MTLHHKHKQQGVTLIVSLILLVLMTLIAVAALRSSSMQESAVANSHEYALSFAAAQSAVDDAVNQISARYSTNLGQPPSSIDCAAISGGCAFYYRPTCTWDGQSSSANSSLASDNKTAVTALQNCALVTTPAGVNYLWNVSALSPTYYWDLNPNSWWNNHGITFGSAGGATSTIPKVNAQPRYVVELLKTVRPLSSGQPTLYYYQITGRGQGRGTATTVVIQTTYVYPEVKD